ncbi:hypothetical protein SIL08_08185, partial [Scandinavium sp. V105_16]
PATLYPKESGLSVSFNFFQNPASAGFLLSAGVVYDCPATLYPKESGLSDSFNFFQNPASAGFLLLRAGIIYIIVGPASLRRRAKNSAPYF